MSALKKKYTIDYLKDNNLILLEAISGSHAYGTNIPSSDVDIRGVFIMDKEDFFGLEYIEQVSDDTNDTTYYEIGRFIQLLLTNNPNILELLNIQAECVNTRNGLMDLIKSEDFISKLCAMAFGGYATQQIKKARGLNKKIVNPIAKEKKTPIDFCKIIEDYATVPLRTWLEKNGYEQQFCGLVKIDHARDSYALFYDHNAHSCFSELVPEILREPLKEQNLKDGKPLGLGYKGIGVEKSNVIRVSSIPKDEKQVGIISYNQDGYTVYCKDYTDYWDWDKKKNEQRFLKSSEKKYDVKNMMHCFRLTEMSMEIASGKGIIVKRPNRDFLMQIRNGEMDYEELLALAEANLKEADRMFKESSLRDAPDYDNANQILIQIRKSFYNI